MILSFGPREFTERTQGGASIDGVGFSRIIKVSEKKDFSIQSDTGHPLAARLMKTDAFESGCIVSGAPGIGPVLGRGRQPKITATIVKRNAVCVVAMTATRRIAGNHGVEAQVFSVTPAHRVRKPLSTPATTAAARSPFFFSNQSRILWRNDRHEPLSEKSPRVTAAITNTAIARVIHV